MDSHYRIKISESRFDLIKHFFLIKRSSIQRKRVKKTARANHEAVNVVDELRYESSNLILYKELSSPIFQSFESVRE